MNPEIILNEIATQTTGCTRCKLHHARKNAVPGAGNPQAAVLFIGEGPGFHENEQGLPFVGAAGQFLDELLAQAKLTREEVFITNVVKCRPPGNRDPLEEELEACRFYLERQIATINPDVIVTLGRYSMGNFIHNGRISGIHGKSFWSNGRMIVPMYHPAAALHQPSLRSIVVQDFQHLSGLIETAIETRRNNPELSAVTSEEVEEEAVEESNIEQLSLF